MSGRWGVRLYVEGRAGLLDAVETETEDDFMYFRDSVHLALEHGQFGDRFPTLMKAWFSDFEIDKVRMLERELLEIHAAFSKLPPEPLDGNWRAKLIRSGRKPDTLAEVYVDKDGAPLIKRLIGLARMARQNKLPIRWDTNS